MAITRRRYLDVILGLFIIVGIGLLGTFIFLIGKERRLFDDAAYINGFYPNVAGLNVGADVLLDGEMGAGDGAEMIHGAMPRSGAEAGMQPMPPQWLIVARGLLRAVASLVPLALFVAGISWVLHRTSALTPSPAA